MIRHLSPDELDLDRSENDEDWQARLEQLESHPDLALEIIEGLTAAQKTVLQMSHEQGSAHSGRGGWQVSTMRVLEKKGCVKLGGHESDWTLTTRGKSVGRMLAKDKK